MTEAALSVAPPDTVAVQLREKDLPARELLELARQLRVICDRYRAPLIVNDRIDVAIAARADGVHLPGNSFAVADARALIGGDRLVGVSTHCEREVIDASEAGADFIVYGPVFDPLSKTAYFNAKGADGLIAASSAASIPLFALGGITGARVRKLRTQIANYSAQISVAAQGHLPAPGFAGVAVIGAVYGVHNPAGAMRELLDAFVPQ